MQDQKVKISSFTNRTYFQSRNVRVSHIGSWSGPRSRVLHGITTTVALWALATEQRSPDDQQTRRAPADEQRRPRAPASEPQTEWGCRSRWWRCVRTSRPESGTERLPPGRTPAATPTLAFASRSSMQLVHLPPATARSNPKKVTRMEMITSARAAWRSCGSASMES